MEIIILALIGKIKPLVMLTTPNELQTEMSILLASTTHNRVQVFGKKIIVKNNFGNKVIMYLLHKKKTIDFYA